MEEIVTQHEDDYVLLQEEMHYHNTMNAFVELIIVYGYDKVIGDFRTAMGNKTWWRYANGIDRLRLNFNQSVT